MSICEFSRVALLVKTESEPCLMPKPMSSYLACLLQVLSSSTSYTHPVFCAHECSHTRIFLQFSMCPDQELVKRRQMQYPFPDQCCYSISLWFGKELLLNSPWQGSFLSLKRGSNDTAFWSMWKCVICWYIQPFEMFCWQVVEGQSTIDSWSSLSIFITDDVFFFSVFSKNGFKSPRKFISFLVFKYLFHIERLCDDIYI